MLKIVAIGGGSVKEKSTLKIDKEIITFSGKKNPKLLFIPTASSDSETYFAGIKKHFESLGCKADVLYLIKDALSKKEIEKKILSSDIIYV
ncbi:Type 1 glutamine amidotransferase-like domain-containing protein [Patescibacteria group bacterium]|nr:Type 1 glutamine amidotransferase-like domain-containing protein [Patescibacteria group bacterium]